ncbi:MAG: MnhB domain-containing protein [Kiritimatiellae bacterium]|nr:MnhB domain-containing protein [Kiritimatiellia bacterium]
MSAGSPNEGMSVIVKTVTRWLKGFIFLYGLYIVAYGHLTPGGGFAGGVIVACAFILIELAEGQRGVDRVLDRRAAAELDSVGALIFLGAAAAGMVLAGVFFKNFVVTPDEAHFTLFSAGIIPACNIGIGLKVGASLFLVFAMLSALHVAVRQDGRRKMVRRKREET